MSLRQRLGRQRRQETAASSVSGVQDRRAGGVSVPDDLLIRATLFHTPGNPFLVPDALAAFSDGAVLVRGERLAAVGQYAEVRRAHPQAVVEDRRPGILLAGLVDLHTHFPQAWMIGTMAGTLLEWLERRAFAEEMRLAAADYAARVARDFLNGLARTGVTTALVFGSHFARAQEAFFVAAEGSGLRVTSGLALSDRGLPPPLRQEPEVAYGASADLAQRWHGRGRLRYAVSPRFALSCSEAMLEVAGSLLRQDESLLLQTHLNESPAEIAQVRDAFPWARDYLAVYERFGLVGNRSVFAHDVHPTDSELDRLAASGAAVAHCPTSNMFLGSGLFPLGAHVGRRMSLGLGSDVGGGTGFGVLKEGLAAYEVQALRPDGYRLTAEHLLYLATLGGATALGQASEIGDLTPGKAADFCLLVPRAGGTLASVIAHAGSAEEALAAVFTLAGEADVAATYVAGAPATTQDVAPQSRD